MGVRHSVGGVVGAVVFTAAATCCTTSTGPPEPPERGAVAERLGPQPSTATEGSYAIARADRSIDQADMDASGLPNRAGELVELRNESTATSIYVAVEAGKPTVVRDGWTATPLHTDRVWNPVLCADLPHVLLGARYIVMLRDAGDSTTFELFDLVTERFLSAPIADGGANVFTLSLRVESTTAFSVLIDRGGELVRRTVDATDLRYRDLPIRQPAAGRVSFARTLGSGYLIDAGARKGTRVQLHETAQDARLVESALESPVVAGRPGQLSVIVGGAAGEVQFPLPEEVQSASIVGATAGQLYVAYSPSTTSIADAVGSIDRSTGVFRPVAGPQASHLLVVALRG